MPLSAPAYNPRQYPPLRATMSPSASRAMPSLHASSAFSQRNDSPSAAVRSAGFASAPAPGMGLPMGSPMADGIRPTQRFSENPFAVSPAHHLQQEHPPYQQHQHQPPPYAQQLPPLSEPGPLPNGSENIQVIVRIRPLSRDERARGDQECVHCAEDGRTVKWIDDAHARGVRASADRSQGLTTMRSLTFDACLTGSAQAPVFLAARANKLLEDALEGYAVTIFAYGQTGSGKTFTMTGGRRPRAACLRIGHRNGSRLHRRLPAGRMRVVPRKIRGLTRVTDSRAAHADPRTGLARRRG